MLTGVSPCCTDDGAGHTDCDVPGTKRIYLYDGVKSVGVRTSGGDDVCSTSPFVLDCSDSADESWQRVRTGSSAKMFWHVEHGAGAYTCPLFS
jgi:hypothetical protein